MSFPAEGGGRPDALCKLWLLLTLQTGNRTAGVGGTRFSGSHSSCGTNSGGGRGRGGSLQHSPDQLLVWGHRRAKSWGGVGVPGRHPRGFSAPPISGFSSYGEIEAQRDPGTGPDLAGFPAAHTATTVALSCEAKPCSGPSSGPFPHELPLPTPGTSPRPGLLLPGCTGPPASPARDRQAIRLVNKMYCCGPSGLQLPGSKREEKGTGAQ